jgi:hypothetical protein
LEGLPVAQSSDEGIELVDRGVSNNGNITVSPESNIQVSSALPTQELQPSTENNTSDVIEIPDSEIVNHHTTPAVPLPALLRRSSIYLNNNPWVIVRSATAEEAAAAFRTELISSTSTFKSAKSTLSMVFGGWPYL